MFAASGDYNRRRPDCHSSDSTLISYDKSCIFGANKASPDVAVWGDSLGSELALAIGERLGREGRSAMEVTYSGCPPATGFRATERSNCAAHNEDSLRKLMTDRRIHTVLLAANFSWYTEFLGYSNMLAGYQRVVEVLHANGKRVILVYPIPTYEFDPPTILGLRARYGMSLDEVGMSRQAFRKYNERAIDLLDSLFDRGIADRVIPEELLCDLDRCRVYSPQHGVLYFHHSHLSNAGARVIASGISL